MQFEDYLILTNGFRKLELKAATKNDNNKLLEDIQAYFKEALCRTASNPADPLRGIHDFMMAVITGRHITQESKFAFVVATDQNRACFSKLLFKALSPCCEERSQLKYGFRDFCELLKICCTDIPTDIPRVVWSLVVCHSEEIDMQEQVCCENVLKALVTWIKYGPFFQRFVASFEDIWAQITTEQVLDIYNHISAQYPEILYPSVVSIFKNCAAAENMTTPSTFLCWLLVDQFQLLF